MLRSPHCAAMSEPEPVPGERGCGCVQAGFSQSPATFAPFHRSSLAPAEADGGARPFLNPAERLPGGRAVLRS